MKIYWLLFVVIALAGCGSSGGSDSSETGAASSAIDNRFVGLWDQTEVDNEYGEDVYYQYISEDGSVIIYDYYGDSFDDMGNCYAKVDYHDRYVREGSDYRYIIGSDGQFSLLVRLNIENDKLYATALESIEGQVDKGDIYEIGTRLTGISVADIENQLCK